MEGKYKTLYSELIKLVEARNKVEELINNYFREPEDSYLRFKTVELLPSLLEIDDVLKFINWELIKRK